MYQYVGIAWDTANAHQNDAAKLLLARISVLAGGWQSVLKLPGLHVYHSGPRSGSSEAFALSDTGGLVLGNVFEKATNRRLTAGFASFGPKASADIVSTRGRQLIENYWGRYVAFVRDTAAMRTYVVVDPCGGLPCLLTEVNGVALVFSRPQLCEELGVPPFSINWDFIRAHALIGGMQSRECGLNEVSEVIGGECLELSSGIRKRNLYWDPLSMAESDMIEDVDLAVEMLRSVTRSCVRSWASCYDGLILMLSGGVDSSIVLACLRAVGEQRKTTCLNYVTDDPDGDEREFARAAASRAQTELVEQLHDPAVSFERMLDVVPSVRPWDYRYHIEHSQFESQLARELGATAICSGGGGDQVFYNWNVHLAIRDYVRNHGIWPAVATVAWDVARIEGKSIWSALARGIYHGLARTPVNVYAELALREELLAAPEGAKAINRYATPPWLEGRDDYAIGKYWQLLNLATPALFYDPLGPDDAPEFITPLRSQPLVELALRIPTYVLIHGGWDRAIARRAFESEVPRSIIRRRTKGGLGDHSARILQTNREFVRELLLDGLLVKEGVLDRKKVEEALPAEQLATGHAFFTLTDHVSTEIWLRKWSETRLRRAVAA